MEKDGSPDRCRGTQVHIRKLRTAASIAAMTLVAASAQAQNSTDLAAAFGARDSVEQISLSPSGGKISYIAPVGGQGSALYTVDLAAGQPRSAGASNGDPERLLRCDWTSETRLACRIYAVVMVTEPRPVSRMIAVDENGANVRLLNTADEVNQRYGNAYGGQIIDLLPGEQNAVLMDRWFVPEMDTNTRLAQSKEGYGVVRIDTRSGVARTVEEPVMSAAEFITDGRGRVRIMGTQPPRGATGYAGETIRYAYRTKDSKRWQTLGEYNVLTKDGVNPLAVDPQLDAAYVLQKLGGRQALYRISLDGSLRKELVFAHPQVDVSGVIRVGRSRRPIGAAFTTDKDEALYFDPELKALAASLSKSLPGLPLIRFVDASEDESKLLLWAGSDVDPGRYYVFDKTRRHLNEIMLARPQLANVKLAPVRAVSFKAADGTAIPGYLTLPPNGAQKGLPAIVMPHGGPGARDTWGFDWLAQFYAARGYAVLQPNFRGSAGYGEDWFQVNGFQSWKTAIGDVNDGARWLLAEGIADPAKLAIVGWSYGGYAALQAAAVQPDLFKAVVAIAPVTDLQLLKDEHREWSDYTIVNRYIGEGPHVREGSPAMNAASIRAPVMMFHGDRDLNVSVTHARRMQDRLRSAGKPVDLVVYPKLDHYLDDSAVRTDMLRRSDAFLRGALKL
jgi:dipeptidyl aminopeptidase/acylaminoacyl peptidase